MYKFYQPIHNFKKRYKFSSSPLQGVGGKKGGMRNPGLFSVYSSLFTVFFLLFTSYFCLMNSQRHLFDIPDDIAYFNCAYYSPQLNESRNRLMDGVKSKSHPWDRTPPDFFSDAETIRRSASSIFGGETDGFAIVPSVSYGLSTAARLETLEELLS